MEYCFFPIVYYYVNGKKTFVLLYFLLHSDECAIRDKTLNVGCGTIKTRAECLTSIAFGILCVWCPDGSCAKKPVDVPDQCLFKKYATEIGVLDFEDCLPAGTQNGCSGSNYS